MLLLHLPDNDADDYDMDDSICRVSVSVVGNPEGPLIYGLSTVGRISFIYVQEEH